MLRFVKSSLRRLLELQRTGAQAPKGTASGSWTVRFAGLLESADYTNQFLDGMGNSDVVMFAFRTLFREVGGESRIPDTDIFGCIVQGIS